MSEAYVIKVVKGVVLFITFMVMGLSIPDANSLTLLYIQQLGFNLRFLQILFMVSGIINLIIALRGAKWNAIWFAVWVMYSVASFFAYLNNANIPLLAVSAYLMLTVWLTIDVLQDAELLEYIGKRLWNREVL
jgi:hypothetical protein